MSVKREDIKQRLEYLCKSRDGRLLPEDVVRDAKSKASPLHNCFEWDDSEAAHQYRIEQARELIRSVKIEIVTTERIISTVRYIRDPSANASEQGYVEVTKIRNDQDIALAALRHEIERLTAIVERVEGLAVALDLVDEFNAFKSGFDILKTSLKKTA